MPRLDALTETARRATGEDMGDAKLLEREDIGPVRHDRGIQQMPRSVPREKGNLRARPSGHEDRPASRAERRIHRHLPAADLPGQRLPQPGAANNADPRLSHLSLQ